MPLQIFEIVQSKAKKLIKHIWCMCLLPMRSCSIFFCSYSALPFCFIFAIHKKKALKNPELRSNTLNFSLSNVHIWNWVDTVQYCGIMWDLYLIYDGVNWQGNNHKSKSIFWCSFCLLFSFKKLQLFMRWRNIKWVTVAAASCSYSSPSSLKRTHHNEIN